jgi:hypothetical protein
MKPLLFLDVDGVINCLNIGAGYEVVQPDPDGLIATVPPGMKARIARLADLYEVVWATAWRGAAHAHFRDYFGLPAESWRYVDYSDLKLTEILRTAGERRWAWVDDDIKFELRNLGWRPDMVTGLLVEPAPREGLTDAHVERLVAFALDESQRPT